MNVQLLQKWVLRLFALVLMLQSLESLALLDVATGDRSNASPTLLTDGQGDSQVREIAHAPRVAADVTPEVLYFHQDATGNLVAMTDESGQVAWRADVRPFGQGSANPPDHPLRFMSQPREADIGEADGLYHLGARTYDPLSGRFVSPDPLLLAAVKREVPQRFNQYSYALNNPYRYHDASGLEGTEFTAQDALKKFLRFYEAKLGPNPTFGQRMAAFLYGPILPPPEVIVTNNQPIRNKAGQEVDLDWGARLAGNAVAGAMQSPEFAYLPPDYKAWIAKRRARWVYRPAKIFWNVADWFGEKLGFEPQTGPYQEDDPNIRGVDLLVDYIIYGGDLRDYFDPTQLPPQR